MPTTRKSTSSIGFKIGGTRLSMDSAKKALERMLARQRKDRQTMKTRAINRAGATDFEE